MPVCPPGTPPRPSRSLVAFSTLWPRARTVFWIYALLIAVSRVVVTAHYPSRCRRPARWSVFSARYWCAAGSLCGGSDFRCAPDGVPHHAIRALRLRRHQSGCPQSLG